MVQKAAVTDSDSKGIPLWRHKLLHKGRLPVGIAMISVAAISLTLWFVVFKIVNFISVG
jgi:hypothetical protein